MVEPHCDPEPTPHLHVRVFYVRISNCAVGRSTPDHLLLAAAGSPGKSTYLRRKRTDRRSKEATFVSTESVKFGGSGRFEVFNGGKLLVVGVMVSVKCGGGWNMKFGSVVSTGQGFLGGKKGPVPVIEVYVAGSCSGGAVVMTQTMRVVVRRKEKMEAIPENGMIKVKMGGRSNGLQTPNYEDCKWENAEDIDNNSIYSRGDDTKGKNGELSWFNAGVRVGVGIGLGVGLGIGIGIGIMVRTYQFTTRNFKPRIL